MAGSCSIFSVRNTQHPLTLKIHNVLCLCISCILDNGDTCRNSNYSDPWRRVELIPKKGQSKKKYEKHKHPQDCVGAKQQLQAISSGQVDVTITDEVLNDDNLPDIVIPDQDLAEDVVDLTVHDNYADADANLFIDLTTGAKNVDEQPADLIEEDDLIINDNNPWMSENINNEQLHLHLDSSDEDIPEKMLWKNILGTLESCTTDSEMEDVARKFTLKPLPPHNMNVQFRPGIDKIDTVAKESIPKDVPQDLIPIQIVGDGNCMSLSVSHSYSGSDKMHLELRARIIIDGILNRKFYLSQEYLKNSPIRG